MRKLTLMTSTLGLLLAFSGCASSSPSRRAEAVPAASLAALPEPVTSFGAATQAGWLYVFGGHKGHRHDYTAEMVSGSFERLNLSDGRAWEALPPASPGQGLALVADGPFLYRIGGMAARNHEGEKQDLYSTPLVQRFDPKKMAWENSAPLPEPRSSHDAAVLERRIFVFGGWDMAGAGAKPVWHSNGLVFDPDHPEKGWSRIPQPFQRRALAVAAAGSNLYCIGGMDSSDEPTLNVDVYNAASGQWSKGPDLPPGKYKGFGCSAIRQEGRIYVTTFRGELLRLSRDGQSWEVAGLLEHPRIAHRLVAAGPAQLIALGGEDGTSKRPDLELLTPSPSALDQKQATLH